MSELGKIVFYLCLAIPVITFLFCLIMGNNIGGAFDRDDYKIWIKEVISSTIYLSLLLYTLLNTAAIFVFNEILTSLIIYFILFTTIHFWNKHYK